MKIKDRIAKLIDVKTVVTFALTGAFAFLAVHGDVQPDIFVTIYTTVIGFYFGTQASKKEDKS